jgi:cytochrome b involved in lipid metabolism
VLDVTKFLNEHPGGKFVLEHNIGRDISKYFYGGYSMDGNLTHRAVNHVHSR